MEALPTAESELTANWQTASLSSRRMESSLNPETKSLLRSKGVMKVVRIKVAQSQFQKHS